MPIYAYKCSACGFAKDVLQKISDAPMSDCPSCAQPAFEKQVTAAGFQLKGSGWYVTDFRGGKSDTPASSDTAVAPQADGPASSASGGAGADSAAVPSAASAPASSATPAAASAAPASAA